MAGLPRQDALQAWRQADECVRRAELRLAQAWADRLLGGEPVPQELIAELALARREARERLARMLQEMGV